VRIFKSRRFAKFARKERIQDFKLCEAAKEAEQGLIDADYGGGVIKQRIARPNEGKSGGYRSIILFRKGERSFFVYGFAKSELANIEESDVRDFKKLAATLLAAHDADLRKLVDRGEFTEVNCHEE
jgi:hypothetical protein